MYATLLYVVFLTVTIASCNGFDFREHLEPINRRLLSVDQSMNLGAPSYPSHLPPAEPILPGHTLLRPALGMLKSALKFPHRELDNGFGVNGNIDHLGLRYDGKNERVLYGSFRRIPTDYSIMPSQRKMYEYNWLNDSQDEVPKHNLRVRSKLNSRLHTSAKTLSFVAKLLRKIRALPTKRRQAANIIVIQAGDNEDNAVVKFKNLQEQLPSSLPTSKPKTIWSSKNDFNVIKVQPYAPTLEDFIPKDTSGDKLRKWWYYHQADFRPLSESEN